MGIYRIVLADDHALIRQGLRRILEERADLKIVGEAGDGLELINLLKGTIPDMVVLDISMPNLRGIEAVREIKSRHSGVKVLILTMHRDKEYLSRAISSGADGYLLKEDADTELFSAVAKIRKGRIYISPSLGEEFVDCWLHTGRGEAMPSFKPGCLTTREREVLKLIAEGKSSGEAADLLCISVRTIEHHRAKIMQKLNLKKTAALIRYAIDKGYM